MLDLFKKRKEMFWEKPWGYSDHCIGDRACLNVFVQGESAIIEKHLKMVEDCL